MDIMQVEVVSNEQHIFSDIHACVTRCHRIRTND